jgi:hypothetical protein
MPIFLKIIYSAFLSSEVPFLSQSHPFLYLLHKNAWFSEMFLFLHLNKYMPDIKC